MKIKLVMQLLAIVLSSSLASDVVAQAVPQSANPANAPSATTKLFIVHFTTGAGWDTTKTPNEQIGMKEHSANLARLRAEGKLLAGARYKDAQADKGMIVVRAASREAVDAELVGDPMVAARCFSVDIAEFKPFYDGYIPRAVRVDAAKPLTKFAWLAGCWEGRTGSATFREHWMPEAGRTMFAMSRTMREDKVISYEAIRLELDADGQTPVYVPTPSGQKETRFKLASDTDGKFVFENLQHDFPQRIIYQQNNDGSLLARIEGMRGDKLRGTDFPMKRANCE